MKTVADDRNDAIDERFRRICWVRDRSEQVTIEKKFLQDRKRSLIEMEDEELFYLKAIECSVDDARMIRSTG